MGTVVVLIGVTVYADRATRLPKVPGKSLKVDVSAKDAPMPEPDVTFKDLDGKARKCGLTRTRAKWCW